MRPPVLALVLAALLAPGALAAGEVVDIVAADVPERTAAGHAFPVTLTLRNKDSAAREVFVFGALYSWSQGKDPCGSAQDPAFKRFTHLVQERVQLPAGATVTYPSEGERWLHKYETADVPPEVRTGELCFFVGETRDAPRIDYLDLESRLVSTRGVNEPPRITSMTRLPESPRATERVEFSGAAVDPEDDPLTFSWDFGHANATGRARGEGPHAAHAFYPEGRYTVTLTVSDGFAQSSQTREVVVLAEDAPPADVTPTQAPTPLPLLIPLAALLLAALRGRR